MANSKWSWQENKQFEDCLVEFPEDFPNRWETIAVKLGTKSAAQVEQHFAALLDDVAAIDAGSIELPVYNDRDGFRSSENHKNPNPGKKQTVVPRKASRPWTDDEHRAFLVGLEKYGKGDWKSISRYMVMSRNPTQVASHAQKYYARQEKEDQNKKRESIFDKATTSTSQLENK